MSETNKSSESSDSRYAKIGMKGECTSLIHPIDRIDDIIEEIRAGDVGDTWIIEIVEMETAEYEGLQEFEGY